MKKRLIQITGILILALITTDRANSQDISGKITFITSKNVYVKFDNTHDITIGDTLQLPGNNEGCLVVSNKSSSSCVCIPINNCELKVDDEMVHSFVATQNEKIKQKALPVQDKSTGRESPEKDQAAKDTKYTEDISGRLSVSSYSTMSDAREDRHRIMSRFSLYADHIRNSPFSFETYLNYRQYAVSGEPVKLDKKNIHVYDLDVKYDINPGFSVILGRKLNPKFSSLGAIDGLQVEKTFGKNYIGVLTGFRPDIYNYTFNPDLFQYGAYLGRNTETKNFYSQTTLGMIEQQNKGHVDRRYVYFQHASTLWKKLNLFSSMELDVYNKMSDTIGNNIRLTNLYVSARYRFSRRISLTLSYDTRKSIIYYETFQTEIERLLNDDIARQGVRIRVNVRPVQRVFTGVSYSRRFQSDNQSKSENIYGYASLSKIPGLGGRLSVSYNMNLSNYLQSQAYSVRYARILIKKKLDGDFYYRRVDYSYLKSEKSLKQNYYGLTLSYNISRKLRFGVSGELSNYNQENIYNLYLRVIKRFDSSRKK